MPLFVVPLAPEDTPGLTLDEWDALVGRKRVLFERPDHPLAGRLRDAGIAAGPFDDEPEASADDEALVCDPGSPRVLELARRGAIVAAGVAAPVDSLTAAHAAASVRRAATSFADLVATMARLRSDDGCPWDREQTHESLRVHLVEEAYEVIDSIDRGHTGDELKEELGDLLLQVAFHARLAQQDGRFDVADVADGIVAKLLYRHPHVFGEATVASAGEVVANWEALKQKEKKRDDPFEGIPESLPALLAAYKSQKRATSLGFEASSEEARARAKAALDRPTEPRALGEALFWMVAAARAAGIDPEGALRGATARFRDSL